MSQLLSDPDFKLKFQRINPPTMQFLNQAPGTGTMNQRVMDDGRTNRQFPHTAIGRAMEEKARQGEQITRNALATTGTFMNRPRTDDVTFNRNLEVEKAKLGIGARIEALFSGGESMLPAWMKSDAAIIGMILIIGYFGIFKSK